MNLRDKKGVISIFLVIIMLSMMILSCVLVDGSRIVTARTHVERGFTNAVNSALAGYDTPLKENYGLFGIRGDDNIEDEVKKYLKKNLNAESIDGIEDLFDLYDFNVEDNFKAAGMYNYTNNYVTEKYIMEHMKYRLPVSAAEFLLGFSDVNDELESMEKKTEVIKDDVELKIAINDLIQKCDELMRKKADEKTILENLKNIMGNIDLDKYYVLMLKEKLWSAYRSKLGRVSMPHDDFRKELLKNTSKVYDKVNNELRLEKEKIYLIETYSKRLKEINKNIISLCIEIEPLINEVEKQYKELLRKSEGLKLKEDDEFKVYIDDILDKCKKHIFGKQKGTIESIVRNIKGIADRNIPEVEKFIDGFNTFIRYVKNRIDKMRRITDLDIDDYSYLPECIYEAYTESYSKSMYSISDDYEFIENKFGRDCFEDGEKAERRFNASFSNFDYDIDQAEVTCYYDTRDKIDGQMVKKKTKDEAEKEGNNIKKAGSDKSESIDKLLEKKNNKEIKQILDVVEDMNLNALPSRVKNTTTDKEESDKNMKNIEYNDQGVKNADDNLDAIMKLFESFSKEVERIPNKFYVNEYAMTSFLNYTHSIESEEFKVKDVKDSGKDTILDYEIEYILNGFESDKANLTAMKAKLFMIRFIPNLIHVITDPKKNAICLEIALAIPGANLVAPLVQFLIMAAWATAETYVDLTDLFEGKEVPFYKTDTEWKTSIEGTLKSASEKIDEKKDEKKKSNILDFDYVDYLRILLILQGKDKTLDRTEDLIQLNLSKFTGEEYNLQEIYTHIEAQGDVSMKYLFMTSAIMPKEVKQEDGSRHLIKGVTVNGGY